MRIRRTIFPLTILLGLPVAAHGRQDPTVIVGTVSDAATGLPIDAVDLFLDDLGF